MSTCSICLNDAEYPISGFCPRECGIEVCLNCAKDNVFLNNRYSNSPCCRKGYSIIDAFVFEKLRSMDEINLNKFFNLNWDGIKKEFHIKSRAEKLKCIYSRILGRRDIQSDKSDEYLEIASNIVKEVEHILSQDPRNEDEILLEIFKKTVFCQKLNENESIKAFNFRKHLFSRDNVNCLNKRCEEVFGKIVRAIHAPQGTNLFVLNLRPNILGVLPGIVINPTFEKLRGSFTNVVNQQVIPLTTRSSEYFTRKIKCLLNYNLVNDKMSYFKRKGLIEHKEIWKKLKEKLKEVLNGANKFISSLIEQQNHIISIYKNEIYNNNKQILNSNYCNEISSTESFHNLLKDLEKNFDLNLEKLHKIEKQNVNLLHIYENYESIYRLLEAEDKKTEERISSREEVLKYVSDKIDETFILRDTIQKALKENNIQLKENEKLNNKLNSLHETKKCYEESSSQLKQEAKCRRNELMKSIINAIYETQIHGVSTLNNMQSISLLIDQYKMNCYKEVGAVGELLRQLVESVEEIYEKVKSKQYRSTYIHNIKFPRKQKEPCRESYFSLFPRNKKKVHTST